MDKILKKALLFLGLGIVLFFFVSYFKYKISNSVLDITKKEHISFWDQDFKLSFILTLLFVILGVTSIFTNGQKNSA